MAYFWRHCVSALIRLETVLIKEAVRDDSLNHFSMSVRNVVDAKIIFLLEKDINSSFSTRMTCP